MNIKDPTIWLQSVCKLSETGKLIMPKWFKNKPMPITLGGKPAGIFRPTEYDWRLELLHGIMNTDGQTTEVRCHMPPRQLAAILMSANSGR